MTYTDWPQTLELIGGLWPKWKPTKHQVKLLADRLGGLNQPVVREAIEQHAATTRYNTPNLDRIMEIFRARFRRHEVHTTDNLTQAAEDRKIHAAESGECYGFLMRQDPARLAAAKVLAISKLGLAAQPSEDIDLWSEMLRRAVRFELQDGFLSSLKGRPKQVAYEVQI